MPDLSTMEIARKLRQIERLRGERWVVVILPTGAIALCRHDFRIKLAERPNRDPETFTSAIELMDELSYVAGERP